MAVWQQLIVAGPDDVLRAFVAGFATGRRSSAVPVFGRDCHLAPGPLGERLKALFTGGSHHVVFVPDALAGPLADAIRERGADLGLKLDRRRPVRAMHFDFRIEAFARDVAKKIRRTLITDLPPDVRVEGLEETTEEDPSARGTEVYSPTHDYIYRGSGRIVGMPPAIFDARERAAKLDFVTVGDLHAQTTAR